MNNKETEVTTVKEIFTFLMMVLLVTVILGGSIYQIVKTWNNSFATLLYFSFSLLFLLGLIVSIYLLVLSIQDYKSLENQKKLWEIKYEKLSKKEKTNE